MIPSTWSHYMFVYDSSFNPLHWKYGPNPVNPQSKEKEFLYKLTLYFFFPVAINYRNPYILEKKFYD